MAGSWNVEAQRGKGGNGYVRRQQGWQYGGCSLQTSSILPAHEGRPLARPLSFMDSSTDCCRRLVRRMLVPCCRHCLPSFAYEWRPNMLFQSREEAGLLYRRVSAPVRHALQEATCFASEQTAAAVLSAVQSLLLSLGL